MRNKNHFYPIHLNLLLIAFTFFFGNMAFSQLEPAPEWEKKVAGFGNGNYSVSYFGLSSSKEREYKGSDVLTSDSILIERNRINHSNNTNVSYFYIDGILRTSTTCVTGEYCLIIGYDPKGQTVFIQQIDSENAKDGWQFVYDENGLTEDAVLYKRGEKTE